MMQLPAMLQGRPFGPEQLAQVQSLLKDCGQWSRYRLSRELAELWNGGQLEGSSKTW